MAGHNQTRLQATLADIVAIGSLRGFKHFCVAAIGREELLVRVCSGGAAGGQTTPAFTNAGDVAGGNLRNSHARSVPSVTDEEMYDDPNFTSFMLAAYERYPCPYVWPRSRHSKLHAHHPSQDPAHPLQLSVTAEWLERDTTILDILEFLVTSSVAPAVAHNPFAVDTRCFSRLPHPEAVVRIGAMIQFLMRVVRRGLPCSQEVMKDIAQLTKMAFVEMHAVLRA
ncbi:hypothetical protein DFJ77DRAFT_468734 [Powellomyces hirtus]|nr:hypothetical protein DFJ77DRAFT_468734 [Powellomyces hirtus]